MDREEIKAIALVGTWVRNATRSDSDIDIMSKAFDR